MGFPELHIVNLRLAQAKSAEVLPEFPARRALPQPIPAGAKTVRGKDAAYPANAPSDARACLHTSTCAVHTQNALYHRSLDTAPKRRFRLFDVSLLPQPHAHVARLHVAHADDQHGVDYAPTFSISPTRAEPETEGVSDNRVSFKLYLARI